MIKPMLIGILTFALCAAVAATWLLTRPAAPKPFAESYHDALREHPGSDQAIDAGLADFARVYGELTHPEIGDRISALYADDMYFNDSLKTLRDRAVLVDYMRATGRMLHESSVVIDQVLRADNDAFVRWTMEFSAGAEGKRVHSKSVGMTHLRFDERGRVVLHQDFWDSAAGMYRNLPVVGYVLEQVDRQMAH